MIYIEEKELQELVQIRNNEAICTSLEVSESFHKRHDRVLRAIDDLIKSLPKNEERSYFWISQRKAADGQMHRIYFMNRDGFSLLVMGFTGKKALEWKLKYIKAFNIMEKHLQEKSTESWRLERKQGKLSRRAETDVIKQLVEYAKEQGSAHADMLYITYSKLANNAVGITNREMATTQQLSDLSVVERIILRQVQEGIAAGMNYHDIYFACKERVCMLKQVAYLG